MSIKISRWVVPLVLVSACARPSAREVERPLPGSENISFLSISVDEETAKADKRLRRFLEGQVQKASDGRALQVTAFPQQTMPYEAVIRAFVERPSDRAYLARITPYAYVAAEMLGAKLDILATYKSVATAQTTYRSYFVVPKNQFYKYTGRNQVGGDATLEDLQRYLAALKEKPAKFIYHDRFSTSSYFLPSLYFKAHRVFAMSQAVTQDLLPIQVERFPSTSTELVSQVANEKADLAAVWDGTKKKFDDAIHADPASAKAKDSTKVRSSRFPPPNDFLVASARARDQTSDYRGYSCDAVGRPRLQGRGVSTDDFEEWYAWLCRRNDRCGA